MEKRKATVQEDVQIKKNKWSCPQCDKSFDHKKTLNRHIAEHGERRWKCEICPKDFKRRDLLTRHNKVHGNPLYSCCGKSFWRKDHYKEHLRTHVNQTGGQDDKKNDRPTTEKALNNNVMLTDDQNSTKNDECSEGALGGTFRVITLPAEGLTKLDPMVLLKHHYDVIKKKIESAVTQESVKWYLSIQVQFSKPKGEAMERVTPHFRGKCHFTLKQANIGEDLRESIKKVYSSFIEYQRQGSNWTLDRVIQIQIHLARYNPIKGSSYIPLPIKLKSKHAVVNVQNKDKKCFMWSVLAALHPVKRDSQRVTKYTEHRNELNFDGIPFPVKTADISKFETQNRISINVLGYEKGSIFPIHVTKQRFDRHVDLLLISDRRKSHYCWIKNVDRLLSDQHSHGHRYFHCMYCLQGFTKERILNDHISYCREHGTQKVKLPTEDDKWLYYKDVRKQLKVPYIVYADFESFQVPIQGCVGNPEKSSTEKSHTTYRPALLTKS